MIVSNYYGVISDERGSPIINFECAYKAHMFLKSLGYKYIGESNFNAIYRK